MTEKFFPPLRDNISGAFVSIDDVHYHTHEGRFYTLAEEVSGITTGNSRLYLIRPRQGMHFRPSVSSDTQAIIRFYENPTISADGTGLTPRNANRFKSDGDTNIIYRSPTVSANGTLLSIRHIGGTGPGHTRAAGADALGLTEWILNPSNTYLFRCTADGGTTNFGVHFFWYIN